MKYLSIYFLLSWTLSAYSENILILHSFWVGSHLYTMRSLADLYVELGHNVTILRYLDFGGKGPRIKDGMSEIILTVNNTDGSIPYYTKSEQGQWDMPIKLLVEHGLQYNCMTWDGITTMTRVCDDLLSRKSLMARLRQSNFSVVVTDLTFNDCGLVYAHNLGVPVIGYYPHEVMSGPIKYTSQFIPPSVLPAFMSTFNSDMTFLQRVTNTVIEIGFHLFNKVVHFQLNNVAQKHYPGTPTPQELFQEMSGFYWDSHPAIEYPKPLLPTFGYIGGIHMRKPRPLPEDLEKFVQSSGDHGFILFSLGASLSADNMGEKRFKSFFEAFSTIKQKVIVVSKSLPDWVPSNVLVRASVPQLDLLAHPKISIIIAHGGIKGVIESLTFGVPILGIPIYTDQEGNLLRLQELGAAKVISKNDGKQVFLDAMNEVLYNPSYRENAHEISRLMAAHEKPAQTAKNILNLVLKTEGGDVLKMAGRKLNIFQYLCFDVALFLFVALSFFLTLSYYLTSFSAKFLYWYVVKRDDLVKKTN